MLSIDRVEAIEYRMPLKRPYGTARGVTKGAVNFIVCLFATSPSGVFEGAGESQPRHRLTGDGAKGNDREAAWSFLVAACRTLPGRHVSLSSQHAAIADIRSIMTSIQELAKAHGAQIGFEKPFRGTMLGIEIALLDAVSRSMGLKLSELLGEKRQEIRISISTISTSSNLDKLERTLERQAKYPMTRVKGTGAIDRDIELMSRVAAINTAANRQKPVWIDTNEGLTPEAARTFIDRLVDRMAAGAIPSPVTVEQPIKKEFGDSLPSLQQYADAACLAANSAGDLEVRIMADESIWDAEDALWLEEKGGVRALNFKVAKSGGLLATLDAAEAALAGNSKINLSIGGMIGTSDLTTFALHNLGRAMPRLDYITATLPGNVEERITQPRAQYASRDSSIVATQKENGLGAQLDRKALDPYVTRLEEFERSFYTLAFGGDTSLGDKHHLAKGGLGKDRLLNDPMYFLRGLKPLVAQSDHLVVNFESVLEVDPISPLAGRKKYLGWDTPERTLACLRDLGVSAVGMANNHAMDFGPDIMASTIARIRAADIEVFGAGPDRPAAEAPLTLPLRFGNEIRNVYVFAVKSRERKLVELDFYATDSSPGVAMFRPIALTDRIRQLKQDDPSSLVIVYPHWNFDYKWPTDRLRSRGEELLASGADFIIGHGTHIMNNFVLGQDSGIAWSLGNFQFNWAGRYDVMPDAIPYSMVARLKLAVNSGGWDSDLRLYPTRCDNRNIEYQPRPVTEEEMQEIVYILSERDALTDESTLRSMVSQDKFGWNFSCKSRSV